MHADKSARPPRRTLPTREEQVATLKKTEEYDVLIIGGGATGAGCALDACTRGEFKFLKLQIICKIKFFLQAVVSNFD